MRVKVTKQYYNMYLVAEVIDKARLDDQKDSNSVGFHGFYGNSIQL